MTTKNKIIIIIIIIIIIYNRSQTILQNKKTSIRVIVS